MGFASNVHQTMWIFLRILYLRHNSKIVKTGAAPLLLQGPQFLVEIMETALCFVGVSTVTATVTVDFTVR